MPRLQPRRIAREIALLSLSQVKGKLENLEQEDLNDLILRAIRTLSSEIHEVLESAASEVQRANERILISETRTTTVESTKAMLQDAIKLTTTAINLLGSAVELPELIQLCNQSEVREYALEIIAAVQRRRKEIEEKIEQALLEWQFNRIAKIDQDILRIAVAEMLFLDIPQKVAINEAVEMAKRYSDPEGYRFINGVLRRVINSLATC